VVGIHSRVLENGRKVFAELKSYLIASALQGKEEGRVRRDRRIFCFLSPDSCRITSLEELGPSNEVNSALEGCRGGKHMGSGRLRNFSH
jgi:hypothetical protein